MILAKVGSGPAKMVKAVRLRKPPAVGAAFKIKVPDGRTDLRWIKAEGVRCEEVRFARGGMLYVLSRF